MDHPLRTLLYDLFVEPILRLLQRVGFVRLNYEPATTTDKPPLSSDESNKLSIQYHPKLGVFAPKA